MDRMVAGGLVAAAAGTPVVTHSGDRVPTQKQDAYKHVLDELGVRTDLAPRESAEMVDETGFGFYYQPNFNPGIDAISERRAMMGVRTFVNTIETLANPAKASVHLGSFYHLPYAKRIIDTFAASERYEVPRVVMFQGMEGYDDIRPGSTTVAVGEGGELDDFEIRTDEYGMNFAEEYGPAAFIMRARAEGVVGGLCFMQGLDPGCELLIELRSAQPALLLGQFQQLMGPNGMAAALLKEGMVENGDQRFWS